MNKLFVLGLLAALAGCSSYSSNMQVGNDQSYTSLKDQRDAMKSVQVYQVAPSGAKDLGEVSAARCYRSFVEDSPTEETLITDLKIAAYARGADGITQPVIEKKSALNKNCWYVLDGKARSFSIPQ